MRKILIVLSVLIILSGCYSRATSILNIEKMPVPTMQDGSPVPKESVRKAILAGCGNRQWTARIVAEDLIEADIIVRTVKDCFKETVVSLQSFLLSCLSFLAVSAAM